MLVRREAGADRHGRLADRDRAAVVQVLEIGVECQSVERLFRVRQTVAEGVKLESHFFHLCAVVAWAPLPYAHTSTGKQRVQPSVVTICLGSASFFIFRIFIYIFILDNYLGGSLLYHPHLIIEEEEDKDAYGEESYETIFIGQIGWTHSVILEIGQNGESSSSSLIGPRRTGSAPPVGLFGVMSFAEPKRLSQSSMDFISAGATRTPPECLTSSSCFSR